MELDVEEEIWKPIAEFPSYSVSNRGRVKGKRGQLLRLQTTPDKHVHVKFGTESRQVHRIVAATFIANPENLEIVRHRDNDPENNDVANLKWATPQETREGRRNNGVINQGKGCRRAILQFSKSGEFIKRHESGADAIQDLAKGRPTRVM